MILQSLHTLYDRLAQDPEYGIVEPGFSPQKIAFTIVLHPDGQATIVDARVKTGQGKLVPAVMLVPGEAKPSGAGINPCFLWDNQTYLLGRQPEDKPVGFGQKRFEAFREKHLALEETLKKSEAFAAVCQFLRQWSPDQLAHHPILDEVGPGFGVFQLAGSPTPVHDDPVIQAWYRSTLSASNAEEKPTLQQCLLTGETTSIARLHPKIKGIPGAQAAGASLVSFNNNAYESYGKKRGFNAPVSESAAFRYGAALNNLLNGPQSQKHRIHIAGTTAVFWTDRPSIVEDIFANFAAFGSSAEEEAQDPIVRTKVQKFLEAVRQGRPGDILGESESTRFYILGLAPNAARVSVRFFYQSSIGELVERLHRHQQHLEIVRQFEHPVGKRRADPLLPAVWELMRETARSGDAPPDLLTGALMRSILEGTPYPESLLISVIRRVQIERSVNYIKAAIIKAVLIRNHHLTVSIMLDPNNTTPAYLQGRLFAVLEKIQEEAQMEQSGRPLDKTIRDTYFAAACSTPKSVFPRLEQLSTHHRRHLSLPRKTYFDRLIGDIKWALAPEVRSTHNLEEQGLFILGYYHQRKALFTKKEEPTTLQNTSIA